MSAIIDKILLICASALVVGIALAICNIIVNIANNLSNGKLEEIILSILRR